MSPPFLFLYRGYNTDRPFPPFPRTYPTYFRVGVRAFMDIHLSFAVNSTRARDARTTIGTRQLSIVDLIKYSCNPGVRVYGYIILANSVNVANQRRAR